MSSPLVSVIIPCFNSERHIRQAVESCLTQDYKNLEVIVVDDGSTDNSLSTLRAVKDKKLKIIRQANQGGSAARNQALRHVRGKYIQYLDADDFISKDKISAQVKILEETTDSYLAVCKTIHFFEGQNPDNGILHETWPLVDTEDTLEWLVQLLGTQEASMVAIHSWLVPKKISDLCNPWDETITTNLDGEYFARIVLAARGIRRSSKGICYYRKYKNKQSLSSLTNPKSFYSAVLALDKISNTLLSQNKEIRAKQALARRYHDLAFRAFPVAKEVTEIAINRAKMLGVSKIRPKFPTLKGNILSIFLGWKLTKHLNYLYHKSKKKNEEQ